MGADAAGRVRRVRKGVGLTRDRCGGIGLSVRRCGGRGGREVRRVCRGDVLTGWEGIELSMRRCGGRCGRG